MRRINLDMIREVAADLAVYREEDEQAYFDTLDGETDAGDILDALLRDDAKDRALVDGIKAVEAQLKARRQRIEARQDTTRIWMGRILQAADLTKAERPIATVSVREGALAVQITDEAEVPRQLCTIKEVVTPDKKAIKSRIEAGEEIPGCALQRGLPVVTVRAA